MVLAGEYFWVGIFCILGFLHLGALARLHPAATFDQNYVVTGGTDDHVNKLNGGQTVQLVLDQASASGFASRNKYLFGHIGMKIKLVPKDSAGTVTAFYTSSETSNHDELDFEFLGNTSGQPYILQTNVFANGIGQREQRIHMWFDPTADFHQYSVIWNKQQIIFEVDDVPIRVFKNNEALGMPYLSSQPMRIFSSLWNGDSWATRGGLQKLNWTHSPFVATYQSFSIDACEWNSAGASNSAACAAWAGKQWWNQGAFQTQLDSSKQSQLKWVQQNYMIYNLLQNYAAEEERHRSRIIIHAMKRETKI